MLQGFKKKDWIVLLEVFTFLGTDSEPVVDEYILEHLLWLFPFVVDLPWQPEMSLKYRNKWGPKNDAFVKSHSRGKTKLDNSFKKKESWHQFNTQRT